MTHFAKNLIRPALLIASLAGFAAPASATDFEVLANTSMVSFESNAVLETITGTSAELSGTISTDLTSPGTTTGTVSFPTNSLRTGIDMRDEHLHGSDWLDAASNPNITFELTSVEAPAGATLEHGVAVETTVTGTLSIAGQSNTVTAPASVTYYVIDNPEVAGTYGIENNVVRIASEFTIELDDYGVNIPGPLQTKVSNELTLTIRLTAQES